MELIKVETEPEFKTTDKGTRYKAIRDCYGAVIDYKVHSEKLELPFKAVVDKVAFL